MKVPLIDEAVLTEDATELDFFGRPAIAFKRDGKVKVYLNVCTHLGGPLTLDGDTLTCQWHGACFKTATGAASCGPAPEGSNLIRLPFRIEDGVVFYVYGEDAA